VIEAKWMITWDFYMALVCMIPAGGLVKFVKMAKKSRNLAASFLYIRKGNGWKLVREGILR